MMQTFTGKQYLQIDIANNFGLDKLDWNERLDWFAAHEHRLEEMMPQADEPALYFASVQAWRKVQRGEPSGYPISLDATSSGLQFLACLTGDRSAAEICNVVDVGHRCDAYTAVYQHMLSRARKTSEISRQNCKTAVMYGLYGSTAEPKRVFGPQLVRVFISTMKELAPAAWELNEDFLAMWNPETLINTWVLPDNFHVQIKVMAPIVEPVNFLDQPFYVVREVNMPLEGGRSLGANTIHSLDGMVVREMVRRCSYDSDRVEWLRELIQEKKHWGTETTTSSDKLVVTLWDHYKKSGYLSARILDVLSPANGGHVDMQVIQELLDSLPAKPFTVISVHDCFRCLPNYGNDLRRQYNLQLHLIAKSNLLNFLLSQITGRQVKTGKLDPTLAQDILDADYALS